MTTKINMSDNKDYQKYRRLLKESFQKLSESHDKHEEIRVDTQQYAIICDNLIALECSLAGIIDKSDIDIEIEEQRYKK